ncbi:hypothetical protein F5Y06DRAFT_263320 [Hypoxylon sp. FL0890]|nr:hypothetical protein F5Y06DRAFT_263320 [Hypoxylon sp. FL0890]
MGITTLSFIHNSLSRLHGGLSRFLITISCRASTGKRGTHSHSPLRLIQAEAQFLLHLDQALAKTLTLATDPQIIKHLMSEGEGLFDSFGALRKPIP